MKPELSSKESRRKSEYRNEREDYHRKKESKRNKKVRESKYYEQPED